MSAKGIRTYLEPELARELQRVAKAQGRSESGLIAEALRTRFAIGLEAVQAQAADTQKRQLNRLEARFNKLMNDQLLIKETLLVFIRVWLEHNPPIEEELAESLAASAENRFERFLDLVIGGLKPGGSISNGAFGDLTASDLSENHADVVATETEVAS